MSDAKFDATLRKCGVTTADGRSFVRQSLDPFHDFPTRMVGLPDLRGGPSIIRYVKKRTNITKPAALAAGNWDINIAFLPYAASADPFSQLGSSDFNRATGEILVHNLGTPILQGPLFWNAVSSGTATFNTTLLSANSQWNSDSLADVLTNNTSSYRLVSGGFEVVDRTNMMDKQGSLTPYRVGNDTSSPTMLVMNNIGTLGELYPIPVIPGPPSTSSDVEQVGQGTWEVKDGCYVPIQLPPQKPRVLGPYPCVIALDTALATDNALTTNLAFRAVSTNQASRSMIFEGASTSGVYLRGLKDTASLDVISHYVIEEFPASFDAPSQSLAVPSPAYDPKALMCVSELFEKLPPGVKVADNASGDWFRKVAKVLGVISAISTAAAPVVAATGPPGLAASGTMLQVGRGAAVGSAGLTALTSMADNYDRSQLAKKEKKKARAADLKRGQLTQ